MVCAGDTVERLGNEKGASGDAPLKRIVVEMANLVSPRLWRPDRDH